MAQPTRRSFLIGLAAAGSIALVPSIAHARVDIAVDPRQAILRAFVEVVVPEADPSWDDAVAALQDEALPFSRYVGLLVSNLRSRSRRLFGTKDFAGLCAEDRTAVVADGVRAKVIYGKLYQGAIFVVQIAYFSAMYHPERGNAAIGFEGAYRFDGFASLTHPEPERFLPASVSVDGNPP
jgi:hypothetical protein